MKNRRTAASSTTSEGSSWKKRLGDWSVYAAAAGAALATAASAEADIVYSGPIDLTITLPLPLNGRLFSQKSVSIDGLPANIGIFESRFTNGRGVVAVQETRVDVGGLNFDIIGNAGSVAKKYALFQPILLPGQPGYAFLWSFGAAGSSVTTFRSGHRGAFGFGNVVGFLGFSNPLNDTKGWIQVRVSAPGVSGFSNEAEIIDFAYNSTPGGPINAGQTQSATPEPGSLSLALLGAGAAGLLAWRSRKNLVRAEMKDCCQSGSGH